MSHLLLAQPAGFLQEKKKQHAESFFRLNLDVYTNMENGERASARDKKPKDTNFAGRTAWTYYGGGEKMRMLAAVKKKESEQENEEQNVLWANTTAFPA